MHPTLNSSSELAKKLQKKNTKSNVIIAVVAILILVVAMFTAYRRHYTKSFYMLNADNVTYTYKAPKTNKKVVNVPTEFKGKTITTLGPWAYGDSKKLEEVVISDNIKVIDKNAFRNCPALTKISIPASVTSIGEKAFYKSGYYNDESNWDGDELYLDGWLIAVKESETPRDIQVNEGTKGIADRLFAERKDIKSVSLPDSLVYLGRETFRDNNFIENVTTGDGLTTIGPYSFWGCDNLKTVDIGLNVSKIGWYAFTDCINLLEINFANPYGWHCTSETNYTNGWSIDVEDAEENAESLTDSLSWYFLYRV